MTHTSFDTVVNRRGTNCGKWDTMDIKYARDGLIHLGVADMDFMVSPAIQKSLQSIASFGIFGYTDLSPAFFKAIARWYHDFYQVTIPLEWIVFCPRINVSAALCVQSLTQEGEGVLIHTPAYGPLRDAVTKNNRRLIQSPLIRKNKTFILDQKAMAHLPDNAYKMMILCSPHNPTGKIWDEQERAFLAETVARRDIILYSDEIHADIVAQGNRRKTMLSMDESTLSRLIVASSPAKTFNIPGLIVSYMIIPNATLREKVTGAIDKAGMHNPSVFGGAALEKAYNHSDSWYADMLCTINENEVFTRRYFKQYFPQFEILERQATFLLWVDYSKSGLSEAELTKWFIEKAGVSVYMGSVFGADGVGYFRLNIGAARSLLEEAFERMRNAL